ncbi:MAG: ROK family protein [Candidatus Omnitrophica bacterium]|nr:ROK family protein [Candidatus Omnitrophota bacterium]
MKHKYSIGIGLNLFDARAILLREDGKIIAEIEKKRETITANETIEVLLSLLEEIVDKSSKHKEEISKIGLALGGIVNKKKGVVYWPQTQATSYAQIALPLKDHLEKKFGFGVVIENDANACAWAEYCLSFPKNKNLVYMFSGSGCGIVVDGKLYRGKYGGAGEPFLDPKGKLMSSRLGEFSFLRRWPADLEMVTRAKELISLGKESSLIKKITSTGGLDLRSIFKESKKKDKVSREILREGAFALGVKIAFLINLLNPEVVVVGGGLEEAGDFFLDECISAIKSFSLNESRKGCKIVASGLSKKATSLGAAFIALHQ